MVRGARKADDDEVVITDPRAIVALAHPARLRIIDALYDGDEMTASELARLVGQTASAVSYHLRALERWGILVRSEPRADARERPWRAPGRSLRLDVRAGRSTGPLTEGLIIDTYVAGLVDEIRAWSRIEHTQTEDWQDVATFSRGHPWLTAEEAQELSEELAGVVTEYRKHRRTTQRHPKDSRRVRVFVAMFPLVEDKMTEPENHSPR